MSDIPDDFPEIHEGLVHGPMGDGTEWFDEGAAVAHLLLREKIFVTTANSGPELGRAQLAVFCNDVFMWGCADAEPLSYHDIEEVYKMDRQDPQWGTEIWCIKRRGEMPQKPVADDIRKSGIWNLDEMGLKPNNYDAWCRQAAEERRAKESAA